MADKKKYYWLKLRQDFFNSREMKKLRTLAGGAVYTIIYLKMQLLSINSGGVISFEKTEESLAEQLSYELDEKEEDIKMTLAYLNGHNLIEKINDDDYLLPEAFKAVGSETKGAERVRKHRENLKLSENKPKALQGNTDVTECNTVVTKCNTEKEKEKEKELEIEQKTSGGVDVVEERFNAFWSAYPRKAGKGAALIAWKKIKPSQVLTNRMLSAITAQRKSEQWTKDKGQYIPNPATWLNQQRWEDELPKATNAGFENDTYDLDDFFQAALNRK